jgi:NAD(P)H-hydrate epimerase
MRIPFYGGDVPFLTAEQMAQVDRSMEGKYEIGMIQMMENAGRNLAELARIRFFGGDVRGKLVAVVAGRGGNGGGALVCARRLSNWGARVEVYLARSEEEFLGVPARQLAILKQMGLSVGQSGDLAGAYTPELIVDGLIGYNLSGAPDGGYAALILWANTRNAPVLSLDVPSGVDATTGEVFDPAIRATATMTLALPKAGLVSSTARSWVGELYLADIGVPPSLYSDPPISREVGYLFVDGDIVRLR